MDDDGDDKARRLTGVFQRLMDGQGSRQPAAPAAGDPAGLGTSYGLDLSLAQRAQASPPGTGAWAWLRRRQTSTSRKAS